VNTMAICTFLSWVLGVQWQRLVSREEQKAYIHHLLCEALARPSALQRGQHQET